ncbi:hypothetical protein ACFLTH_04235, partial [Bacteroidota bacterium]
MSISVWDGKKIVVEKEFADKHPDVFASTLAANTVVNLAEQCDNIGFLDDFRSDLNFQIGAQTDENGLYHLNVSVAGQVNIPTEIDLKDSIEVEVNKLLDKSGYRDFGFYNGLVDIKKVTSQAEELNETTRKNKFGDSCVPVGYHIASSYVLNGTFPGLAIANDIDASIDKILKNGDIEELRPDGKVHVVTKDIVKKNKISGFSLEYVNISIAHDEELPAGFREEVRKKIIEYSNGYKDMLSQVEMDINAGGSFIHYFVQADSAVNKVKDAVIINGGKMGIGSDAFWGKCLYKASSTMIPFSFLLAKTISDVIHKNVSITGLSMIGQEREAMFFLEEIYPDVNDRVKNNIDRILEEELPTTRNDLMDYLGIPRPVNIESYRLLNDVQGFHN